MAVAPVARAISGDPLDMIDCHSEIETSNSTIAKGIAYLSKMGHAEQEIQAGPDEPKCVRVWCSSNFAAIWYCANPGRYAKDDLVVIGVDVQWVNFKCHYDREGAGGLRHTYVHGTMHSRDGASYIRVGRDTEPCSAEMEKRTIEAVPDESLDNDLDCHAEVETSEASIGIEVNSLRHRDGYQEVNAGTDAPKCERVSCSLESFSSIWYCARAGKSGTQAFREIADHAQKIVDDCSYVRKGTGDLFHTYVHGILYIHEGDTYVRVGQGTESCSAEFEERVVETPKIEARDVKAHEDKELAIKNDASISNADSLNDNPIADADNYPGNEGTLECLRPEHAPYVSVINEGIRYLREDIAGAFLIAGGNGGFCKWVSCSWDAAIYVCVDAGWQIQIQPDYIADRAWEIVNRCTYKQADGRDDVVAGVYHLNNSMFFDDHTQIKIWPAHVHCFKDDQAEARPVDIHAVEGQWIEPRAVETPVTDEQDALVPAAAADDITIECFQPADAPWAGPMLAEIALLARENPDKQFTFEGGEGGMCTAMVCMNSSAVLVCVAPNGFAILTPKEISDRAQQVFSHCLFQTGDEQDHVAGVGHLNSTEFPADIVNVWASDINC